MMTAMRPDWFGRAAHPASRAGASLHARHCFNRSSSVEGRQSSIRSDERMLSQPAAVPKTTYNQLQYSGRGVVLDGGPAHLTSLPPRQHSLALCHAQLPHCFRVFALQSLLPCHLLCHHRIGGFPLRPPCSNSLLLIVPAYHSRRRGIARASPLSPHSRETVLHCHTRARVLLTGRMICKNRATRASTHRRSQSRARAAARFAASRSSGGIARSAVAAALRRRRHSLSTDVKASDRPISCDGGLQCHQCRRLSMLAMSTYVLQGSAPW